MNKKQLQADISESREEVIEENPTPEQIAAADAAWEETLNSPESLSFLDSLITQAMKEMDEK